MAGDGPQNFGGKTSNQVVQNDVLSNILKDAGWSTKNIPTAVAIIYAEHGGKVDASAYTVTSPANKDGSHDLGLMQINDKANADILKTGDWKDPTVNAKMGLAIFNRQGWKAWSTYNDGSYKKYLTDGQQAFSNAGGTNSPPSVGDALNAVGSTLEKIGLDFVTAAVILVFFILGVVIIVRKPIASGAVSAFKSFTPAGKLASAASEASKLGTIANSRTAHARAGLAEHKLSVAQAAGK